MRFVPPPDPPRWLRALAGLLIRGPHARWILADLDEAYGRDVEQGMSPGASALRYARNALASAARTAWDGLASLGASHLDVKLGLRMVAKHPGLSLVAVFALTIGIPVGLLPLHIIDSFGTPLPVDEGDRVVLLRNWDVERWQPVRSVLHDFEDWRTGLASFEGVGVARTASYNVLSPDGRAAPVAGAEVSAEVFRILRVPPLLGRGLDHADQAAGAADVVVLSHGLWRSRLAGDPDVVGTTIRVGGAPHTVVGVMPEGFLFPFRNHLWVPFRHDPLAFERGQGPEGWIMARLAPGATLEGARLEMQGVGRRMALERPTTHAALEPRVARFTQGLLGWDDRDVSDMLGQQIFALLVLALACGNVGILILARTSTRTSEIAIRTALGASRARIVGQLFVESLVLAVVAAGTGLLIAEAVAGPVSAGLEGYLPFWVDFSVRGTTVATALGLATFSAVLAGVLPALRATGTDVEHSMRQGAAGGSRVRFGLASSALIVAQVVASVWVLSTASAFLPGYLVPRARVGVEADRFLYATLSLPGFEPVRSDRTQYRPIFDERVAHVHAELAARLRAEPGVGEVAIANALPGMDHVNRRIEVEGATGDLARPYVTWVDVGFFRALEHRVLAGRDFTAGDLDGERPAIVNERFVERVLGSTNALGRRVRIAASGSREAGPWHEIVGVVGTLGVNAVQPDRDEGIYLPLAPGELHPVGFALRVGSDPSVFTSRLREIAAGIDPAAMIEDPGPLHRVFNADRFVLGLLSLLMVLVAGVAVTLSAAGLYALMSFAVAQRTREIGLRTALGARPWSVASVIGRRALLQLVVGVAIGLVLAAWTMPLLQAGEAGRLFDTGLWQLRIAAIGLGVVLVGMLACAVPTRRSLSVRPADALRAD